MLTVLHQVDGYERLYACQNVEYCGPLAGGGKVAAGPQGVALNGAAGYDEQPNMWLRGGRVYVMNEAGKTVATYILPDAPHEEAGQQGIAA